MFVEGMKKDIMKHLLVQIEHKYNLHWDSILQQRLNCLIQFWMLPFLFKCKSLFFSPKISSKTEARFILELGAKLVYYLEFCSVNSEKIFEHSYFSQSWQIIRLAPPIKINRTILTQ